MAIDTYGNPFLIQSGTPHRLNRILLDGKDYNEDYIRNLVFDHPSCLPIAELDGAYKGAVSICKELRTPVGPLDALLVNPDGRLVVIEAKLWRNPQARREVVAQVLDYAKELSRWDYEDLQRAVSQNTGRKGNSLYEIVKATNPDLEESAFVDAVSRSLRDGRFLLLILGDGIREGAGSITNFIEKVGSLEFTFGLVELGLYQKDGEDMVFVQPRVLARTEIIRRSIVTIREGRPVIEEETGDEEEAASAMSDSERWYLDFWKEFKAELQLDDPDQAVTNASKYGNLYFAMPPSGSEAWIATSFRSKRKRIAVYIRFSKGNLAERFSEELRADLEAIKEELGSEAEVSNDKNGNLTFYTRRHFDDLQDPESREPIKRFFAENVNLYVNTFKPRLERILEESLD